MLKNTAYILVAGILLSITHPVSAQEITANLRTRYLLEADLGNRHGDMSITESQFNLQVEDKIAGQLPVTFSTEIKYLTIDENVAADIPNTLIGRQFRLGAKGPIPYLDWENFYLGLDLMPTLNTDGWDWSDSAFRMPMRAYLIHRPNEQWTFVGGLVLRPDYDQEVLPILGLIYKPDDRLTVNLASGEPHVHYRLNERLALIGEASMTLDEYEVTRNQQDGVVLQNRQFSAGLGAELDFNDQAAACLTFGRVFARKMEYLDTGEEFYPEAAFYINGKLFIKF